MSSDVSNCTELGFGITLTKSIIQRGYSSFDGL